MNSSPNLLFDSVKQARQNDKIDQKFKARLLAFFHLIILAGLLYAVKKKVWTAIH